MALPDRVTIREVGAREGFQTLPAPVPTERKLELIDALSATGVSTIEVASYVRPDRVPNMADAEAIVAGFRAQPSVRYTALYLNVRGLERAATSERLENDAWIPLAASDDFLKRNNNSSIDEQLAAFPKWIEAFRAHDMPLHGLMLSCAFGTNETGRVPAEAALDVVERAERAAREQGASFREICLADTTGYANPAGVERLVSIVREKLPEADVSLHLHDTRGCGIANVYAGLLAGVRTLDASVGGLGGCPFVRGAAGNVCTEDIVFLCEEIGVATGIDLEAYVEAARVAADIIGHELPGKFYRALPIPSV